MLNIKLDQIDLKILSELQADGRMTNVPEMHGPGPVDLSKIFD